MILFPFLVKVFLPFNRNNEFCISIFTCLNQSRNVYTICCEQSILDKHMKIILLIEQEIRFNR